MQTRFPRWRAGVRTIIQGGMWRWALALGFAVALGGGAWFYDVHWPRVRTAWPQWKAQSTPAVREVLLWIEFTVSIGLSIAALCWFTALIFAILSTLAFLLPRWVGRHLGAASIPGRRRVLLQFVGRAVEHDRLLGTVLNLVASCGSLGVMSVVRSRPLDFWDIGIQGAIAVAIELIVLQVLFSEGQLGWPRPRFLRGP
jgi:hypothetical protein